MKTNDAARLARYLMHEHGLVGWVLRFDRAKNQFGICRHGSKVISLSVYLVQMNEEAPVRDVILHEIAHAIAGHKAGHGPEWKQVCRRIGARPVRCYGADVNKPPPKWIGTCPDPECGQEYPRLRLQRRVRESSCPKHGNRQYQERFQLTWKRVR